MICNCRNCLFILNVLIIPISREATLFRRWFVLRMAEPSKKDYRHFNVKTVKGINDFATMKEAVYRRYKRVMEENGPFPQLVIIDGGKGPAKRRYGSHKRN